MRAVALAGALWLGVPAAWSAPDPAAEAVSSLLDAAAAGQTDRTWCLDHVDPGPAGWTAVAESRWTRALDPGGPLVRALGHARGIAHVARGPGPTRVVLDSAPRLSVLLDASDPPRVVRIETTSCVACDERTRFARDLIADVRRRGRLAPRLVPGIELDVAVQLAADRSLAGQHWTSRIDAYLRSDQSVASLIAGAVTGELDGDVVRLTYADGRADTWRIDWLDGTGWTVAYEALAPDSPLRLDAEQARQWRRDATEADARLRTWRPTGRATVDGAGRQLGHDAVGFAWDPRDDTLLVAVLDIDRTASALFRVRPSDGAVLARTPIPAFRARHLDAGPWVAHWPFAYDPATRRAALTTPDGVVTVSLDDGQVAAPERVIGRVAALDFDDHGRLVRALDDGRIERGDEVYRVGPFDAPPLALDAGTDDVQLVTHAGEVIRVPLTPDGQPEVLHVACAGQASGASRRPRDGTWAVACVPGEPVAAELVPDMPGTVLRLDGPAGTGRGVGWAPEGEWLVLPGPGGGLNLLDDASATPIASVAGAELIRVEASPDGDHLAALGRDGIVRVWSRARLLSLHGRVVEVGP